MEVKTIAYLFNDVYLDVEFLARIKVCSCLEQVNTGCYRDPYWISYILC